MTRGSNQFFDSSKQVDRYLADISCTSPLTAQEERELTQRMWEGDQAAREELITANLRFVVTIAQEYIGELPFADLISAGNVGLIAAADRFDSTKGFKFITYAVWWIRQAIYQALRGEIRAIRLPDNKFKELYRLNKARKELFKKRGEDPSLEELASELDIPVGKVEDLLVKGQRVWSLDSPAVGSRSRFQWGEGKNLIDTVANGEDAPDIVYENIALIKEIDLVFEDALDERERIIMRWYFGLDYQTEMTLEAIGGRLSLTRERVRQIKEKALRKLRNPIYAERLRFLFEDSEAEPITPERAMWAKDLAKVTGANNPGQIRKLQKKGVKKNGSAKPQNMGTNGTAPVTAQIEAIDDLAEQQETYVLEAIPLLANALERQPRPDELVAQAEAMYGRGWITEEQVLSIASATRETNK